MKQTNINRKVEDVAQETETTIKEGDMIQTADGDLVQVVVIGKEKLIVDNNINEYEINTADVTEVF